LASFKTIEIYIFFCSEFIFFRRSEVIFVILQRKIYYICYWNK